MEPGSPDVHWPDHMRRPFCGAPPSEGVVDGIHVDYADDVTCAVCRDEVSKMMKGSERWTRAHAAAGQHYNMSPRRQAIYGKVDRRPDVTT